mmetsp:Transcript_22424/g.47365  ORF Transcript_22424/g.47365 Transcript_22424/m.47365 type:complete len:277 (+) Transcript_22424:216-1046(+)
MGTTNVCPAAATSSERAASFPSDLFRDSGGKQEPWCYRKEGDDESALPSASRRLLPRSPSPPPPSPVVVVNIGINLTNKAFKNHWKSVVQRAIDAGVHRIILTGTSLRSSRESLELAKRWHNEEGTANLYATVGAHPHDAKTWSDSDGNGSNGASVSEQLRELLGSPFAVAVGECGLDYNRNFSCKADQILAFREQVKLAHDLGDPIFVHEREAHDDLMRILDEVRGTKNKNSTNGDKKYDPGDSCSRGTSSTPEASSVLLWNGVPTCERSSRCSP